LLSVVVPCLDEDAVLPAFRERCVAACEKLGIAFEIVFVNDGSSDGTWALVRGWAASDPRIVGVDLSRRFGHQYAVTAGLEVARGELVLLIDADLQDPPELLASMMERIHDGADVAYGVRAHRTDDGILKRATAYAFYRLMRRLSDTPLPLDTGDFRLMRRRVVDALLAMPERQRFIRGMVAWLGFRQVGVPYERDRRRAGVSKYPFRKMVRFAVDAITSFSIVPLRISSMCGMAAAIASLALMVYTVYSWRWLHVVPGWSSEMMVIAAIASVQLFALGVLGEYVGRIYLEAKGRPSYVVQEIVCSSVRATDDEA
jgi:dolichol-phosphate mannosyltransferase